MSSTEKTYLDKVQEKMQKQSSLLGSIMKDQRQFNQISTLEKMYLKSIIDKGPFIPRWGVN